MKPIILITKEVFIKFMDLLKQQYDYDSNFSDTLNKLFESSGVLIPKNCINEYLINLIKKAFNDDHKDSWIDYFIYELDFGRNTKLHAFYKNGDKIDLYSSEKLYSFLVGQDNELL